MGKVSSLDHGCRSIIKCGMRNDDCGVINFKKLGQRIFIPQSAIRNPRYGDSDGGS